MDKGTHCKIEVKADPKLNGKIVLDFALVDDTAVYIFLQPNNFDHDEMHSVGMVENWQVYKYSKGLDKIQVPTDWTIYIAYNYEYLKGKLSFNTWVEELTEDDNEIYEKRWQPTGTVIKSAEVRAEEKKLREKAEEEAAEEAR
mmetsp:Transcript_4478/g.6688  ORF Transcript_4478/g.6688 Transcript_4478/m.6688 type:complete len:143 (+) Transcript_4478:328-756(+)